MKAKKRIWRHIAVSAGVLILAVCGLEIWHKYHFCQGWSDHYAARAMELRGAAKGPDFTPDERREHLMAADWHDIISRKYALVARQPWRPYPSYPLITSEEQRNVASKH